MLHFVSALSVGAIAGIVIAALAFALFMFMVIRTILAKKPVLISQKADYDIDKATARDHLIEAIKIKTVSPTAVNQNFKPFIEYRNFLEKAYPMLHKIGERIIVNDYALIFKIKGSDASSLPICFLSHQDVVPAPVEGWDHDPFGAEIIKEEDGDYIYGRGTMDMKGHMIALLEAVEYLLKTGFAFKRDLYLCFGHDEEVTGQLGAVKIVEYLKAKSVTFEYVLDEGGIVLDGKMLGIDGKIALIATGEKGYADYKLSATRNGGHSSSPVHPTSIEVLAEAITKLNMYPMKSRWTTSTKQLFKTLAPYMNPVFKFVCVNRDIFAPVLKWVLTKIDPAVEAVVRTTFAPTMIKGSDAVNVISPTSELNLNCRMLKGDTLESVKAYIEKVVGKDIKVEQQIGTKYNPASAVSDPSSPSYKIIEKSINEAFDKLIPAPFTFIAASDAKYYYPVANNVYRFTPYPIGQADAKRIHALNERVKIDDIPPAIAFFIKCIENSNN